jgi:hypothetical protein
VAVTTVVAIDTDAVLEFAGIVAVAGVTAAPPLLMSDTSTAAGVGPDNVTVV